MILEVRTYSEDLPPPFQDHEGLRFTIVRARVAFRDPVFVWADTDGYKHTLPTYR